MTPEKTVTEHVQINKLLDWVDRNVTKALYSGPVVVSLGREGRSTLQNDKAWPMYRCFEPVLFNGRYWKEWQWKNFLMSAFNQEVPPVGFYGEPVPMCLSTSKMSKKRFSEFIEFVYAAGSERDVVWSDPAIKFYQENCGI